MNDLTKELLEALKGLMALPDHRVDLRDAARFRSLDPKFKRR